MFFLLIGQGIWILYLWLYKKQDLFSSVSFSVKIQYIFIFTILIAFVIIGSLIISNTNRQYESYHHDRLLRKSRQILSGLDFLRSDYSSNSQNWNSYFQKQDLILDVINLSEIHAMDINIYSKGGKLIVSSQPEIYEQGLISEIIIPDAIQSIIGSGNSQLIMQEQVSELSYISAYLPLLNKQNEIAAILNLPYYAKEKNLKEEISNFLVYFINIYVLLFVLAGILGLIISNSITRPISVLGSKMRQLQLGVQHEPIEWKNKDEIGQLINQYNKMVLELEKSARIIAQSERESAWRDMAKQVAHEIKNPLTPMKLSIQHLQMTASGNDQDVKEKVKLVSRTLIEQIENLSNIASEFSAFAKMPTAQMEELNVNEQLQSVVNLFKNQIITIRQSIPDQLYPIFADKGQIVRVFNNIIKNAIQSIPDPEEGEIFIGLKHEGEKVIIKVEDNGVGIPKDKQDKVFIPNFTTKSSGMGIGLAMAKKNY